MGRIVQDFPSHGNWNKIVFKKSWYVSARLKISSNLQCLHYSSCSLKCYSIHYMCQTICDVISSYFLGRLVQCERKGWDKGRWVGIYTQRVKTAWLCVGLAVKVPQQCHYTNSPGKHSSHLTRPPCSVQVWFISKSWLALPKQLDHKCAQNDRVQSYVQPGAGSPICRVWLPW